MAGSMPRPAAELPESRGTSDGNLLSRPPGTRDGRRLSTPPGTSDGSLLSTPPGMGVTAEDPCCWRERSAAARDAGATITSSWTAALGPAVPE